jgi:ABC-type antimicrobial peptide transport system permease subunit
LATSVPVVQSSNVELTLGHDGRVTSALIRGVSPGLLEIEGIKLREGRFFSETDTFSHEEYAIINQRFAELYFPDIDPLGKTIALGGDERVRVVGVIADVHQLDIDKPSYAEIVLPLAEAVQSRLLANILPMVTINMVARSRLPLEAARHQLESILSDQVPSVAIGNARDFVAAIDATFAARTVLTTLFKWAAILSSAVAAVAFFTLLDYRMHQQNRSITIRVALGARSRDILALVVLEAVYPICVSLCLGLSLTWGARRVIQSSFHMALPPPQYSLLLLIGVFTASSVLAVLPATVRSIVAADTASLRAQ